MKSYKWIILLLLASAALAACALAATPTPNPTEQLKTAVAIVQTTTAEAMLTAIPTATATRAPTHTPPSTPIPPTLTDTPTLTATATPTPTPGREEDQSTPAPRINLKEVGDRLWSLSSFAFEIGGKGIQGEWIHTPLSWHIWVTGETDEALEFVTIRDRQWVANLLAGELVGEGEDTPLSCAKVQQWEQAPEGSLYRMLYDVCDLGASASEAVLGVFGFFFYDQEAEFASGPRLVDDTPSYEYTWRDKSGNVCHLYMSTEAEIPIMAQCADITLHLSHFNDPANVIRPPTSEMPEKLHIDDARMALNGLSNFRYRTTQEFTDTRKAFAYYSEGLYVQLNQAWRAKFGEIGEEPFVEFLFHPSIGETLLKGGDMTMWFPVSWDEASEEMARDSAPFAFWPDPPQEHRVGVLQPGSTRTVAGLECNEYLFTWTGSSDYGEAEVQVRLCVTPEEMIPLRVHGIASLEDGTRLVRTLELSHINDPTNVVEPPEEYVASSK